MSTRTEARAGMHANRNAAQPPPLLAFARQVAAMPSLLQRLVLLAFGLGTVAHLIPDLDNSTLSNIIYTVFSLPIGVSLLTARGVLAVETAVHTEQAAQRTAAPARGRVKPLTARRVRKARAVIARDACPARWGIRHRWAFDGYFWHRCTGCRAVS